MNRLEYPGTGEAVYAAALANGLSVRVVPKPGYSRKFAVFSTHYGGADRRFTLGGRPVDTPAGVAHYLEHKMFDMPDGDALTVLNAAGASPNAFTSDSITAYYFECTDRFDENLRTLLSFVSTPYFTQASVDKERGIIAQEIRMYEDNPDFITYENLMRRLFRHSPLRDTVAGTVESIDEITPEILYSCHQVFYHPSNMALCVVGDVDPDAVLRAAQELLTPDKAEKPGRDYGPPEDLLPVESFAEKRMDVSDPLFMLGLKLGPTVTGSEALRERLTAKLALRCLCGPSSPWYIRCYSEGLLNASFGSSIDHAAGQSIAAFEGDTSGDPLQVRDTLFEEIGRIRSGGFDEALFERQRRAEYGTQIRALANFRGLAVSLCDGLFTGYDPLEVTALLPSITASDAAAWVRERLVPERFALSVVRPKEE